MIACSHWLADKPANTPRRWKAANRASLSNKMIRDAGSERTCGQSRVMGGEVGGWLQTNCLKGPSLVWKWWLQRADMIKYLTFPQHARGCLDICCVLCSYLASPKHMGNQHAHISSGNTRMAPWSTHTVMYLKEKSTQKTNWRCMMHPGSILFSFPTDGWVNYSRHVETSCCLHRGQ